MVTKLQALEQKLLSHGNSKEDLTEKVTLLNEMSELAASDDPVRALELSREALEIAEKLSDKKGIALSHGHIGFSYFMQSELEKAINHLHIARDLAEELKDRGILGKALATLGMAHRSLGNFDKALSFSQKASKVIEKNGTREWRSAINNIIGGCYHDVGDFERSLQYHQKAWEIYETLGEAEKNETVTGPRALNGLGTVYQSLGEYDNALNYFRRSLKLFQKIKDKLGESRALNDLADIFRHQGETEKALEFYFKSLKIREQIGNKQPISTSLINLGRVYIEKKEYEKALENLHRALTLAMEIRSKPRILQANFELSHAYTEMGEFANALSHFKLYHAVKEEISGDEAISKIKNLQIGFEVEKSEKEAEISRLKNVELKEKNKQLKDLLRELEETQSQLVQTEKMASLGTLVGGIVHEINTPIGAIKSSSDVISRCIKVILNALSESKTVDDLKESRQFNAALKALQVDNQNAAAAIERITKIVESLKGFTQLDQAAFQRVDVNEGLENSLTLLEHVLKDRIELVKEFADIPKMNVYPGELNQVYMNLLSNAIAAIDGKGTITVRTFVQESKVHVDISDTGIGLTPEQKKRLFEPRFTRKGSRISTSMGLFTSYNIIQKHEGQIKVDSEIGKGSTFTIILPMNLREPK